MSWQEKNLVYNELIKQLFQSKDWQERSEAARQLGLLKEGRSVNLLCRALRNEKDKMVQNRIMEAMGRIGDGKSTLRIIEKLKEELDNKVMDKFRIIYMIESLININDKRALAYIGYFLSSSDKDLKEIAEKAFDIIEPDWRKILEKERENKSIEQIFKINI